MGSGDGCGLPGDLSHDLGAAPVQKVAKHFRGLQLAVSRPRGARPVLGPGVVNRDREWDRAEESTVYGLASMMGPGRIGPTR